MVFNRSRACHHDPVMEQIDLRFAKRLKQLRQRYGLTQEELAGRSEISVKHIQRLESSKPSSVRLSTLERLAKVFGLSVSSLLKF